MVTTFSATGFTNGRVTSETQISTVPEIGKKKRKLQEVKRIVVSSTTEDLHPHVHKNKRLQCTFAAVLDGVGHETEQILLKPLAVADHVTADLRRNGQHVDGQVGFEVTHHLVGQEEKKKRRKTGSKMSQCTYEGN